MNQFKVIFIAVLLANIFINIAVCGADSSAIYFNLPFSHRASLDFGDDFLECNTSNVGINDCGLELFGFSKEYIVVPGEKSTNAFVVFPDKLQSISRISFNIAFSEKKPFDKVVLMFSSPDKDVFSIEINYGQGKPYLQIDNNRKIGLARFFPVKNAALPRAEFREWFTTVRLVVDSQNNTVLLEQNLSSAWQDYQMKGLDTINLSSNDVTISGLKIFSKGKEGAGNIYFSNFLVETGALDNQSLDDQIGHRRSKMSHPNVKNITDRLSDHAPFKDVVIWETNPITHTPNSQILEYLQLIPHLKDLGVSWVYILPLWTSNMSPVGGFISYPMDDGYTFNPVFGTNADFKFVVSELHRNNIKVMLDFCLHSAAWSSPLLLTHPEWFVKIPGKHFYDGFYAGFSRVRYIYMYRFDFSYIEVQEFINNVLSHWVKEFDLDGIRLDVAHSMFSSKTLPLSYKLKWGSEYSPADILARIEKRLKHIKPDILILTESANRGMTESGADFEYSGFWRLRKNLKRVSRGEMYFRDIVDVIRRDIPREFPSSPTFMWGLETHDYDSATSNNLRKSNGGFGAEYSRDFMGLISTLPGAIIMFGGQEFGNRFLLKNRVDGRGKLKLTNEEKDSYQFYKNLLELRKKLKFYEGHPKDIENIGSTSADVAAYIRRTSAGRFLIVINVSGGAKSVKFSTGNIVSDRHWIIGTSNEISDPIGIDQVNIPAHTGLIFKIQS